MGIEFLVLGFGLLQAILRAWTLVEYLVADFPDFPALSAAAGQQAFLQGDQPERVFRDRVFFVGFWKMTMLPECPNVVPDDFNARLDHLDALTHLGALPVVEAFVKLVADFPSLPEQVSLFAVQLRQGRVFCLSLDRFFQGDGFRWRWCRYWYSDLVQFDIEQHFISGALHHPENSKQPVIGLQVLESFYFLGVGHSVVTVCFPAGLSSSFVISISRKPHFTPSPQPFTLCGSFMNF